MTGYAQGRFSSENHTVHIAIKSLNHRYLELSFKGTGITADIEKLFKKMIKGRLHRGKVELTFNTFETDPQNWDIQINEPLLDAIAGKFSAFQSRHPGLTLSMDPLLRIPMIFHLESHGDGLSPETMAHVEAGMESVLQRFLDSRRQEGALTAQDIRTALGQVSGHLERLKTQAREAEDSLLQRYRERIGLLLGEVEADERRIVQEAAIAADRSCISEEISRISTHRDRLERLCEEESEFIGREADFLSQELLRETHTIAAKTSSMEIHSTVLQIRREVEKIKQQVQNVE